MNLSDQQILIEIVRKNQLVFDELYKVYYKRLFILSYSYTKSAVIAEEVVHDVFMKIWNLGTTPLITHSLNSYLSKATINTSINIIKKEKSKLSNTLKYIDEQTDYFEDEDDDAERLEKKLLMIETAIDALPPQCKKVLLLSKFQKLKQQEIADELNISIKTVKNHLTYGYKKIREMLTGHLILKVLLSFELYRTFFKY